MFPLLSKTLLIITLIFSISSCTVFAEKEESEWTVKEFYDYARDYYDSGQWQSAINYYEKLKSYFPYGTYAEKSYLELAYSYYKFDEPESAKRELDEFIRIYPKHSSLPYAYHLKALATDSINQSWFDNWLTDPADRDMKSTKDAYQNYNKLLVRFPQSKYSTHAKKRMAKLKNTLARHEYKVAEYYYERKSYLATVTRTKYVIANYPNSKIKMASLKLMRNAYYKLGMDKHAENAQQAINNSK